ncbi:MAG: leucine-rich repeat domain-containing protein [Bacilli bacterium]|nr:leucine-rich repeat domain-containing protein [Bacilli bacterium]
MNLRDTYLSHQAAFSSPYELLRLLPFLPQEQRQGAILYAIASLSGTIDEAKRTRKRDISGAPMEGKPGFATYKRLGVPVSMFDEFLHALDFPEEEELAKARRKFKPKKEEMEFVEGDFVFIPFLDGLAVKKYRGLSGGEVRVPDYVQDLEVLAILPHAFYQVRAEKILFPETLRFLCEESLASMYARSVYFPEGLLYVGRRAFCRSAIEEISLPGSTLVLDQEAFALTPNLMKATLPERLLHIGPRAFAESGLKSVIVPRKIAYLSATFQRCPYLNEAVLPDGLSYIGDHCFDNCRELKRINLPRGLLEIGDYAFDATMGVKFLQFPLGLRKIGAYAFRYFEAKDLSFPLSLLFIGEGAFQHAYVQSLNLNEGLEYLGPLSFAECTFLAWVSLPSSLRRIDMSAFFDEQAPTILYRGLMGEWRKVEKTDFLKKGKCPYSVQCHDGKASF